MTTTLLDVLRAEAAPAAAAGFTKDQLATISRALSFTQSLTLTSLGTDCVALVPVVQDLIDHPPTWEALLGAAVATPGQAQLRATYAAEIQSVRDGLADDDLEIDDSPLLSPADDGVWVNAWVWVPKEV